MKTDKNSAQILGFSVQEIKILESLTESQKTIQELAISTNIPRTSLYYMLPKLLDRQIVSKNKLNKKIYWEKNPNQKIKNILQTAIDQFTNQQENAFIKKISNQSEITIFKGANEMANFWKILANSPRGIRWYGIQPGPSIMELIPKNKIETIVHFNKLVKKQKHIVEGIVHENYISAMKKIMEPDDYKELLKSFGGRSADYAKLPDQYMNDIYAEIYLFDDKVGLLNWKEEFAVIIDNKDVYRLLLEMFKATKYMLDRYDQNEKIAKTLVKMG